MTVATLSSTEFRHGKRLALFEQRGQWLTVSWSAYRAKRNAGLSTWLLQMGHRATDTTFEMAHCDACKHAVAVKLGLIARGTDSQPASIVLDGLAQIAGDRVRDRILGKQPPVHETDQRAAAAKYDDIFKRFEGD